jgi:hypothetical protein
MPNPAENKTVFDFAGGGSLYCPICEVRYRPNWPIPIYLFVAMATAFDDEHKDCHSSREDI